MIVELVDIKQKAIIESKRFYIIAFINSIGGIQKNPKDTNYKNENVYNLYLAMYTRKQQLINKVMFETNETILDNIISDIEDMKELKINVK